MSSTGRRHSRLALVLFASGQVFFFTWIVLAIEGSLPLWGYVGVAVFSFLLHVLGLAVELRSVWLRCRHDRCARCGYPRRGNITGICPECGESVRRDPWASVGERKQAE